MVAERDELIAQYRRELDRLQKNSGGLMGRTRAMQERIKWLTNEVERLTTPRPTEGAQA